MKHLIKSLKRSKKVSLTENEKNWSKEELIHFMEKHPVRDEEQARHQLQKARTAFVPLQLIHSIRPMTALIAIALVFSLGGGASVAASDSLPGEALYPVKIHLNERIGSVLAFSEEAEADFHLEKAEIRLRETEQLASKNAVRAEVLNKTEVRFDKHIEKTEELAAKFEAKGKEAKAAEINARLEAMMEVHSQILALLEEQLDNADTSSNTEVEVEIESTNEDSEEFGKFVAKIKTKAEASEEDEEDEEESEETGPSKQAALNAQNLAEKHMERVTRFTEKRRGLGRASVEISGDAQTYLEEAETLIAQGEAQLETESYAEAFASFHQAHKSIQKANSHIASGGNLGLQLGKDKQDNDGDDGNTEDENEEEEEDEEEDEEEEENDDNEIEVEAETQLNVSGSETRTEANATLIQKLRARF